MAGAKEVGAKIRSVQNTQKITSAMEMVAASKMRKAQDRMSATRPYAGRIKDVIGHVAKGRLEYQHPFLIERPARRVGYLVVSSDRGLCGGLNINLFKKMISDMEEWSNKGVEVDICALGVKAEKFFHKFQGNIVASVHHLGDQPTMRSLIGPIKVLLDSYIAGEIDRIYLAYNEFVNTMVQKPVVNLLLPISDTGTEKRDKYWDYIYEPNAQVLLESLLKRYVESLTYQAVVENVACEQAARMVAMKSATENAGELISEFRLIYNKARQAAITQELSEIVAGAAAV